MKALTIVSLLLFIVCAISAQGWSTDPNSPTVILNGPGEQVLPKVAIDSEGYSFFTLFNNASGGYLPQILAFNPGGSHQLDPPTGYMISNHPSNTWLTDYDLTVDQQNNALITFQDIRNVTSNVYVYKFARSNDVNAQFLWGADGIALSADTSTDYANYTPKILNTSNDFTYVAWMNVGGADNLIMMQKLSPTGEKLWGNTGVSLLDPGFDLSWPQLLESGDGSILVKYYSDSGPSWSPTRHLKVLKLNAQGMPLWDTVISNAGGIAAWNQIIGFESDGTGGAILAWHDDRNSDNINEVYISHISDAGSITSDPNGSLITGATGQQQYYPVIAVDYPQSRINVFYKFTDADQNNSGLGAQAMSFSGSKLWGDNGIILEDMSPYVVIPQYATMTSTGATCIYEYGISPSSDVNMHVRARCLNSTGASAWNEGYVNIASNDSPKLHFDCDKAPGDWIVAAWEGGGSAYDTYAMRLNSDGSLGVFYAPVQNLSAELISSTSVQLSWEYPPNSEITSVEVYRDDLPVANLTDLPTTYLFENLPVGSYSFKIRAYYEGGDSADSNVVTITLVSNADENSPALREQLMISPNPFTANVNIRWFDQKASKATFRIYNLKGQIVETKTLQSAKQGWNEINWNSSRYTNGIYLLRLETGDAILTRKILKKD